MIQQSPWKRAAAAQQAAYVGDRSGAAAGSARPRITARSPTLRAPIFARAAAKWVLTVFSLSPSLGEWALFNRVFFARAFEAWFRELR